jgi:hypothetical protein
LSGSRDAEATAVHECGVVDIQVDVIGDEDPVGDRDTRILCEDLQLA